MIRYSWQKFSNIYSTKNLLHQLYTFLICYLKLHVSNRGFYAVGYSKTSAHNLWPICLPVIRWNKTCISYAKSTMLAAKCRLKYHISILHRIGKIRYLYVHAKSKRLIYLKGGKKVVISDYLTSVKFYNSINLYEHWTSLLLMYFKFPYYYFVSSWWNKSSFWCV